MRAACEDVLIADAVQVVLRVDEVSFVGAKQARHLLQVVKDLQEESKGETASHRDTRQMQAIQAGDFFHQVMQLEKEGGADVARPHGIRRQRDPALLEITRTLNREDHLFGECGRGAEGPGA